MAGVALGIPSLLSGCGSDDDNGSGAPPSPTQSPTPTPTPGAQPRESRHLHFDLSFTELSEPRLHIVRSRSHHAALIPHDRESRDRHRELNPALQMVTDESLTHFVEDVDLPADAMQSFAVRGKLASTGEAALAGLHIHLPSHVARVTSQFRAARGRGAVGTAKMRLCGIGGGSGTIDDLMGAGDFYTPLDAALALIFHYAEIMNIDLDQGATILDMINTLPCTDDDPNCMPFIGELAFHLAESWPATESGMTTFNAQTVKAWAQLVPLTDTDGNVVFDQQGETIYNYDISDESMAASEHPVREIVKAIFDDEQFEGSNWHDQTAITVSEVPNTAGQTAGTAVQLKAEYPAGTAAHGVHFISEPSFDELTRKVTLEVRNDFLRSVSTFVGFANEAGELKPKLDFTEHVNLDGVFDSNRALFLTQLPTAEVIFGIPVKGGVIKLEFTIPEVASKAKLYFGSLGVGGNPFGPEAVPGAAMTVIFNLGLPSFLLAMGLAEDEVVGETIKRILTSPDIWAGILELFFSLLAQEVPDLRFSVFGGSADTTRPYIIAASKLAATIFLSVLPKIIGRFAAAFTEQEAEEVVPIVGLVVRYLFVMTTAAQIAETTTELMGSRALFTGQISFSMTTTVMIHPDPTVFRFPAQAATYEVVLTYDEASTTTHKAVGDIPDAGNRADPFPVTFDGVPSGGKVQAQVTLFTVNNWVIGQGISCPIDNLPETATTIDVTIKERLVRLSADTQYQHTFKLTYDSTTQPPARVWSGNLTDPAPAPTATRADASGCEEDQLCELTGITFSGRTGMAGYGFRAGGQDVDFCDGSRRDIMYRI